ncbi:MAG: flagellar biosynthesis protein FlhB [Rhodospirillaceae bacterium]|nr:flagellar biosynthesis protein FlhB [Rhodospirillaceae bacterium]
MADDSDDKTEEPTGKRLSKAQEDGDVPISREVGHLLMILAILVAVGTMIPWIMKDLIGLLRAFIERPHVMHTDIESMRDLLVQMIWRVGLLLAMPISMFMIIGLISTLGQVGFLYTPKKIMPKLSNLNPIAGAKQLFSTQSLVEAGKSMAKIAIIITVLGAMVVPSLRHPDQIIDQDLVTTIGQTQTLVVMLLFFTAIVMGVIAALDIAYTRWSHKEKPKMTKQEVKDEHKDMEGDPKVKGRIRAIRLERHKKRMMANVPKATVVITNPTHFAVALKYDMDSMAAPTVVAKGADYLALRIRQIADQHEVPIVENPPLARALYAAVEVDQEIPAEHYKAVAEVIGFVMRLKGKLFAK